MTCLQCNKPANENGEVFNSVKIRECADGHRTGRATAAMVRKSDAYRRVAEKMKRDGVIELESDEKVA